MMDVRLKFRFFIIAFCIDTTICQPTTNQPLVDKVLNELGYTRPKHPSGWKETFMALVEKYVTLVEKYAMQKNETEKQKLENIKDCVIPLIRGDFEDFEKIYQPAVKLTKETMVEDIKTTFPNFSIPESMIKSYELSLHYVRIRYILKNSKDENVMLVKQHLNKQGIDDDLIARCSGIFYERSSDRIHVFLRRMSLDEIKHGLELNGIEDTSMIKTAIAIFAIPKGRISELEKLYHRRSCM